MKIKYIALIGSLVGLTAGCSSEAEENPVSRQEEHLAADALHIHFQSGFYQDTIRLYHGQEKVYENVLTSEEDTALTDQFTFPKAQVRDTLYFQVAQDGRVLKGHIPPDSDQYIGFYLTSGTAVNIFSKDTPFQYH